MFRFLQISLFLALSSFQVHAQSSQDVMSYGDWEMSMFDSEGSTPQYACVAQTENILGHTFDLTAWERRGIELYIFLNTPHVPAFVDSIYLRINSQNFYLTNMVFDVMPGSNGMSSSRVVFSGETTAEEDKLFKQMVLSLMLGNTITMHDAENHTLLTEWSLSGSMEVLENWLDCTIGIQSSGN